MLLTLTHTEAFHVEGHVATTPCPGGKRKEQRVQRSRSAAEVPKTSASFSKRRSHVHSVVGNGSIRRMPDRWTLMVMVSWARRI